jgi:hypothetical protein
MSTGYRFYLLKGDHIVAVETRDCLNDVEAMLQADAVLQATTHPSVEVGNGSRRIGILSKPAAATGNKASAADAIRPR